jgi:hypothetical protein
VYQQQQHHHHYHYPAKMASVTLSRWIKSSSIPSTTVLRALLSTDTRVEQMTQKLRARLEATNVHVEDISGELPNDQTDTASRSEVQRDAVGVLLVARWVRGHVHDPGRVQPVRGFDQSEAAQTGAAGHAGGADSPLSPRLSAAWQVLAEEIKGMHGNVIQTSVPQQR